ncbi:MAG TPA: sulfate ABC transporter substrate-binding protein [Oceanipulchritudo sp.]|nr:sulfate ABC transporter substrate-binding protein [Oceanipulchritudo sp.]
MAKSIRKWIHEGDDLESARRRTILWIIGVALVIGLLGWFFHPFREKESLLVVSYDVTRELFTDLNAAYLAVNGVGKSPGVILSHAGSVRQAHNVARGLAADIINFASQADIDLVSRRHVGIDSDWRERFPYGSSPYQSTIVFLVRKGNPRNIQDWGDLFREDVRIVSPDPEVSGAGRYAYLAATVMATHRHLPAGPLHPDLAKLAWEDLVSLYARVEFIELGARQALDVFRRRERGDVFLTWESEALRLAWAGDSELEIVTPSMSILAEPVVTIVDAHVDARGTREGAMLYVEFLFSPEGQAIVARNGFRPRQISADSSAFPAIKLISLADAFGNGSTVWEEHFAPGGTFEALLRARGARRGGVD